MRRLLLMMLLTALVPQLSRADGGYGLTIYVGNDEVTVTEENRADVLGNGTV